MCAVSQTSTGKTYTMSGPLDGSDPGVCSRAAATLFEEGASMGVRVEASFVQIYKERVMDLLVSKQAAATSNLKLVKDEQGHITAAGATVVEVGSSSELIALHQKGCALRETASQALNSESSRSHAVLTLAVSTSIGREAGSTNEGAPAEHQEFGLIQQTAKLHLVDLAGSERVKDSQVSGKELREAIEINKSLFTLVKVVKTCADNCTRASHKQQLVPYRESKLTQMLSSAIGGNCSTLLIACVTPSQLHASESLSTLKFAKACSNVKNQPRVCQPAQKTTPKPQKKAATVVPWGKECALPDACGSMLATAAGQIWIESYGEHQLGEEAVQKTALILHAEGSSCASMRYMAPCMLHLGYRCIFIDQPGCGNSPGSKHSTRSQHNLQPGGPVGVGVAVLDALGVDKAVWVGYDWGAGAALSAGLAHPKRVDRVISLMPSYGESKPDELASLKAAVLLLWIKQDVMHSWGKWQRLAAKIPKRTETIMQVKKWKGGSTQEYLTNVLWKELTCSIAVFLGGADPRLQVQQATTAVQTAQVSTTGQTVLMNNMITITDTLSTEQREAATCVHDPTTQAVTQFRHLMANPEKLQQMYSGQHKAESSALFGALPVLSPATLQNESILLAHDIWTQPPLGLADMRQAPRYFEGRTGVLLPVVGVGSNPNDCDTYLKLLDDSEGGKEKFTTHRTRLIQVDGKTMQVAVETCGGGEQVLEVQSDEVTALNQPHVLPLNEGAAAEKRAHTLQLEDGLVCDYTLPMMKAKMMEIALTLEPLVQQLHFCSEDGQEQEKAVEVQLMCIRAIRNCLDVVSFQRGRERDRNSDSIHKMALHGQGHCHTLSSLMAAFLYPWQALLGVDLRYRGGYSLHADAAGKATWNGMLLESVSNTIELHHWLEYSLRPQMCSFVCDLWVQDGDMHRRGGCESEYWLAAPIEQAYDSMVYTHWQDSSTRSMFPIPVPLAESDL